MASKKSSRNAMKKIDKQLDKLLKEKREIDDTSTVDRKEIQKKVREISHKEVKKNTTSKNTVKNRSVKKNNRKSDAIVVQERKKKSNNSRKKEAIVVKERKEKPIKKKPIQKKEAPKKVKKEKKVGESTMRLQKLEEEIRTLYDKVEDVVEDIESTKSVDVISGENLVITDVIVKDKEELEEEPYDRGGRILNIIALILFVIFLIMFIMFIGFIIFVCTY